VLDHHAEGDGQNKIYKIHRRVAAGKGIGFHGDPSFRHKKIVPMGDEKEHKKPA
jgi:hypothetical protein